MLTVMMQIENIDQYIRSSIDREQIGGIGHLSQGILSNLRNLVDACIVGIANNSCTTEFEYEQIKPAKQALSRRPDCKFLLEFHRRLQGSVSHYTLSQDASERLMRRYIEYLYRLRKLMAQSLGVTILQWLEEIPTDDSIQVQYHETIASVIDYCNATVRQTPDGDRYYVWRSVPFFCDGNVYYEVTLVHARDELSNTDHFTAFTSFEMPKYYAVKVAFSNRQINVHNAEIPIQVIAAWNASARPCELKRLAKIIGIDSYDPSSKSRGYRTLMYTLERNMSSLREIACLGEVQFNETLAALKAGNGHGEARLTEGLRRVLMDNKPGKNVIGYLSQYLRNGVMKAQQAEERCSKLGGLRLRYAVIPFDEMPLCTSLRRHNPSTTSVLSFVDVNGREHELLEARLKHRAVNDGEIFTERDGLPFKDIDYLMARHNDALYWRHRESREICSLGNSIYIKGYAGDAIEVLHRLGLRVGTGITGHSVAADRFLTSLPQTTRYNNEKKEILRHLFTDSTVAMVYGSAGTGKSTFVSLVADFMQGHSMLFLAWTHAAVENLENRVGAGTGEFMTVASSLNARREKYDLVVIDECSTIPNDDMRRLIEKIDCDRLLLVGDDCQIGSITFGNWFELAKKGRLKSATFALSETYRTSDKTLLDLWRRVREYDALLEEYLVKHGFVDCLGAQIYEQDCDDQVTLCLSYNGLYGVNNINRILQLANGNEEFEWGRRIYKVGDPVVFGNSKRFQPVIHSNTRGTIRAIKKKEEQIFFDIEVQSSFNASYGADLRWLSNPTASTTLVRINVFRGNDDADDEARTGYNKSVVPFQIAYAVSIHKAQGLEFDSVRLVLPSEVDDYITRDIFYTGISRAKKWLKIYWTPETQKKIVERFSDKEKRARKMNKEFGLLRQLAGRQGLRL